MPSKAIPRSPSARANGRLAFLAATCAWLALASCSDRERRTTDTNGGGNVPMVGDTMMTRDTGMGARTPMESAGTDTSRARP